MKQLISILAKGTCLFLLAFGQPQAHAYTHPCIPGTSEELAFIKANLDKQPWKRGYEIFAADRYSQLTYTMQGPFETVTRKTGTGTVSVVILNR